MNLNYVFAFGRLEKSCLCFLCNGRLLWSLKTVFKPLNQPQEVFFRFEVKKSCFYALDCWMRSPSTGSIIPVKSKRVNYFLSTSQIQRCNSFILSQLTFVIPKVSLYLNTELDQIREICRTANSQSQVDPLWISLHCLESVRAKRRKTTLDLTIGMKVPK